MKCKDIDKLISEFLDNELEETMARIVEEHIKMCRKCFQLLNSIEKTIELSRRIYRKRKVPKEISERVFYQVRIRFKK